MKFLIPACILSFSIASCGGKGNNTIPTNNEDPSKSIPDYYTPENPITTNPSQPSKPDITNPQPGTGNENPKPKTPGPRNIHYAMPMKNILETDVPVIEFNENNEQTKDLNIKNISSRNVEFSIEVDKEKDYSLKLITNDCTSNNLIQSTDKIDNTDSVANNSDKKLKPNEICKISILSPIKCNSNMSHNKDFTQLRIKTKEYGNLEIPISICSKFEKDIFKD